MGEGSEKSCSACGKASKWFKTMPLQYNGSQKGLVCAACFSNPESLRRMRLINTAVQFQKEISRPTRGKSQVTFHEFIAG